MYCQNCGNELRQNLAFCNLCGARINSESEKLQSANHQIKRPDVVRSLSKTTGYVGVSGIISVASLIYQLIQRGDVSFALVVLVIVFSALVFGIVFLLINQISRLSSATFLPSLSQNEQSELLPNKQNNNLLSRSQPFSNNSVTEYTTRNLENMSGEKY